MQIEALIMLIVITVFLGGLAYFGTCDDATKSASQLKRPAEGKSDPNSSSKA